MLDVLCTKTVREPEYQTISYRVQLYNYDKLTPRSARAALAVAGFYTGTVQHRAVSEDGEYIYYKTYRVYPNSVRKLYEDGR